METYNAMQLPLNVLMVLQCYVRMEVLALLWWIVSMFPEGITKFVVIRNWSYYDLTGAREKAGCVLIPLINS